MARAFRNGAVSTALDEPSDIPGHVWPPIAIFQQREGVVGCPGMHVRVDAGRALSSGDILYPWWTARRSGRGSIGGGVSVGVPLYGADNEFSGMMDSGSSSVSSGVCRRDRASALVFLGPGR